MADRSTKQLVRRAAIGLCPPLVLRGWRRVRPKRTGDIRGQRLFDGDAQMFRELVSAARVYGEYGMGLSTLHVFEHTGAQIRSVDTSAEWTNLVRSQIPASDRVSLEWIDVGELGSWGRPVSYSKRAAFPAYFESIWRHGDRPDVVLIDGRFRVACFLTTLLRSEPGTSIIFDDYWGRPHYHVVEEIITPADRCGRQALFRTPDGIDVEAFEQFRSSFEMVLE